MTDSRADAGSYYWIFPREKYAELESGLKIFPEIRYRVIDIGDDLIYLEMRKNSYIPGSLEDIFVDLHGERLNSKKDFEERMQEHEFI